jgi:transposase
VRKELSVRDALVRSRTRMINVVRSLTRQEGVRLASGSAEDFTARIRSAKLPGELSQVVHPLVRSIKLLSGRIQRSDKRMMQLAASQQRVRRLMTAPGVGVVTAMAFAATIEPAERFASGEAVGCYLGLVPSEDSSSERRRLGRITKTGDKRVRWLLVETGWRLLRSNDPEALPLRRWGERIATRGGRSKAAVALARKVAVKLWAMDRDKTEFQMHPSKTERKVMAINR